MERILSIWMFLCIVIIHISCDPQGRTDSEEDQVVLTEEDTISTISLLFVGDVMGHSPQIRSAYDPATKTYDYEHCFKYVKPIIEKADFAVANLEVTLANKPPYAGYPRFRSPDALGYALREAGFDLVVTANNHSNDAGKRGLLHTIDTLQGLGLYQTGTFRNAEERKATYPLLVTKEDFKLAFLNYTYGTNGLPDVPPTIVNMIDTTLMENDMKLARALKPDAIIVLMHWGLEYKLRESEEQRDLTSKLFHWGADLVIGSHPHVVQPIVKSHYVDNSGNHRETVVTYSLGNFISNQTKPNTDGGLIYEIDLKKHKVTNDLSFGDSRFIPVWRYIDKGPKKRSKYYILPVSACESDSLNTIQMSDNDIVKMKAFAEKSRDSLLAHGAVERLIKPEEIFAQHQQDTSAEAGSSE